LDGRAPDPLAPHSNLAPGAPGRGQAALVEASADEAASRLEFGLNKQPHRHGSGVPAARGQSTKNRAARRRLIEMKGLRIEVSSEREGPLPFDAQPPGTERLPHCKIFQVALAQMIHDSTPARRWFRAGAMNPLLDSISLTIACSSRFAGVATPSASPRRTMKPFR